MNKNIIIFLIILVNYNVSAQNEVNSLKYVPTKIYDYFTNDQPNCIINNGEDVKHLVNMLGKRTLVLSDDEYRDYNLSNYNIICMGTAKTNEFINSLDLPYRYNGKSFSLKDTSINMKGSNFMAVWFNPYNLSNRLIHIKELTKGYNNFFFKDAQFVIFKEDSSVFEGEYHNFFPNVKNFPSRRIHKTSCYPNTQLIKFPNIKDNQVQVDTNLIDIIADPVDCTNFVNDIKNRKVILLGENHYYKKNYEIAKNIILELNKQDHYPYIILEKPYSYTKMINEYIAFSDNEKANLFFQNMLEEFVWSLEDSIFFNNLRTWNRDNPGEKIKVLCTDIEHAYKRTIKHILIPLLESSEIVFKKDSLFSITYLKKMKSIIRILESDQDQRELRRLIYNLIHTFRAYNLLKEKGFYSFNKIRQETIHEKYEKPLFFRSIIKNNKFIVFGGSEHTGTKNKGNLNNNSEGYYLEYINPYTRGLTYSIRLLCLSYKMDSTVNLKINPNHLPDNYSKMLYSYKKAWNKNAINEKDSIFIFNNYDS